MNDLTQFNGVQIAFQGKDMVNLNDLWRASGSQANTDPRQWTRLPNTKQFIDTVAQNLNVGKSHIIKTTRGKGGGTWAHWQIALAYAKYLSPELHMYVNQVFKERVEEDQNPELAYNRGRERAIKGWKGQGKTDEWIAGRLKGIDQRKEFTGTLKRHGVTGSGYGKCTNNIQEPILGKSTQLVKQELGLKPRDSIRNHVGTVENIGIMLAEALSVDNIERGNSRGNEQCAHVCLNAGSIISRAIREARV